MAPVYPLFPGQLSQLLVRETFPIAGTASSQRAPSETVIPAAQGFIGTQTRDRFWERFSAVFPHDSLAPSQCVRGWLAGQRRQFGGREHEVGHAIPGGIATRILGSGRVVVAGIRDESGVSSGGSARNHGVTIFGADDTLTSFIFGKRDKVYHLGINPDSGNLEAHDEAAVSNIPEYCGIRLVLLGAGQRPRFYFWDAEAVFTTDGWVPFRVRDWNFAKHPKHKDECTLKSLFSLTLSIMIDGASAVTDAKLPVPYKHLVGLLYDLYRHFLTAKHVRFFHEMMRLDEWRGGRLSSYVSRDAAVREDLSDFAERVAATMGLDRFILSISGDGILTAVQDERSRPPEVWSFLITAISPGAFTVARRNHRDWELVNPRVYGNNSDVALFLAGPYADYDERARLGLRREEIDTPARRTLVASLLSLAARGSDYQDLASIISMRNELSPDDYLTRLIDFSVARPYYMDFLSRVPHLDPNQPELRFLTAVDQIYVALFTKFLHKSQRGELGTYGFYYLRYALRIYVAERVRKYLLTFESPTSGAVSDRVNLFSDFLLDEARMLANPRTLQRELFAFPTHDFLLLAMSYRDQAEFIEGSSARTAFTQTATEIAQRALYPDAVTDEA